MQGRTPKEAKRPHRGGSRDALADVQIFAGRIVDVNPVQWTCIVRTETRDKIYRDVAIGSMYLHPMDGEGIHAMPEPGAPVWVARSSEGDLRPFIVAFRGYYQKDTTSSSSPRAIGARTNRPTMVPGDIFLQTRDRNGLRLRRGGVTEIYASPLSRTVYQARDGGIHAICKNYKLDTLGGGVRWLTSPAEKNDRGKQTTHLSIRAKEFSSDKGHVVRLEAGGGIGAPTAGVPDGESGVSAPPPHSADLVTDAVLRLRVFADGDQAEDSLAESLSLSVSKDGMAEWTQSSTMLFGVRGGLESDIQLSGSGIDITTGGALTATAATVAVSALTSVSLSAPAVDVVAEGLITLSAPAGLILDVGGFTAINDGAAFVVGAGTSPVLVDAGFSTLLSAALGELTAGLNGLGVPTPLTDALVSSLNVRAFTSSKLQTE